MSSTEPHTFPLEPRDSNGHALAVGNVVVINSVASCAKSLPREDQARLFSLMGQHRAIVQFDSVGFVWLSFASPSSGADFCLLPPEVTLV